MDGESFGERLLVMVDESELQQLLLVVFSNLAGLSKSKLVSSVDELLTVLEGHSEDKDCCRLHVCSSRALAMSCGKNSWSSNKFKFRAQSSGNKL